MTASVDYCRANRSSQEYHTGPLGLRKRSRTYGFVLSHLAVLLLGVIIGASVRKLVVSNTCPAKSRTASTPIPASVFIPTLPTVMTPDERFVGWNDAVNQNWLTILEGTGDGVWIPNAGDYGLAEGFQAPSNGEKSGNATKRFYHISNQHQLHCLNIVRMAHYHRIEDSDWLSSDGKKQAAYHVEHCVEYLRLTIMCGDSLVIEANSPPGSPVSEVTDAWGKPLGWGITKQCINWENLQHWQRSQLQRWRSEGQRKLS